MVMAKFTVLTTPINCLNMHVFLDCFIPMFDTNRTDVRQFYLATWRKHLQQHPLEGVEALALPIMLAHPEYHALFALGDAVMDKDYLPESGITNPFLHMSLHLALTEQLSIDQPPGVRAYFDRLVLLHQDVHATQHVMLECLAEMIWQAQRYVTGYDVQVYFNCLDNKSSGQS